MGSLKNSSAGNLRRWQVRTFSTVWITYFAYYFCRYNLPIAKTRMCEVFSWDAAQFGQILTAPLLMYAVGQFVNGQLADPLRDAGDSKLGGFGFGDYEPSGICGGNGIRG